MEDYFSTTLCKLKSNNYKELTIVLGNESCDLDSAVSSLVYAVFLYWQHNQIKCKVCTKGNRDESTYKDDIFVSMMNVRREDFCLKTEVTYCFKELGIDLSNLVFRDDYDLNNLISSSTKIVLVDHHVLSKNDTFLAPYVTEIIDHRPIDKNQWLYKDDTRSTIELVGSCSTLVAQRIKDLGSLVAGQGDFFKAYPICSELLHRTIILDTVNFSKEVNKATPHDTDVVLFLESFIKPTDCEKERERKLVCLVEARKDVSTLTSAQLLRKDVKIVEDIYIPSFPILVKEFFQIPEAEKAVTETLPRYNCNVALLLGMNLNKKTVSRDAAILSSDNSKVTLLSRLLQDSTSPSLQLQEESIKTTPSVLYFKQLNLSASRKQYIPIVNEFLKIFSE